MKFNSVFDVNCYTWILSWLQVVRVQAPGLHTVAMTGLFQIENKIKCINKYTTLGCSDWSIYRRHLNKLWIQAFLDHGGSQHLLPDIEPHTSYKEQAAVTVEHDNEVQLHWQCGLVFTGPHTRFEQHKYWHYDCPAALCTAEVTSSSLFSRCSTDSEPGGWRSQELSTKLCEIVKLLGEGPQRYQQLSFYRRYLLSMSVWSASLFCIYCKTDYSSRPNRHAQYISSVETQFLIVPWAPTN